MLEAGNPPKNNFLSILTAGIILGVLEITFSLAFTTPIFSGPFAEYLPRAIGVILFGAALAIGAVAFTSSSRISLVTPQDIPIVVIAAVAVAVSSELGSDVVSERAYFTVIAVMSMSALISALLMTGLGMARLGKIARFIPYPVVGGLLAGTGWLLTLLSIKMMADVPVSFAEIGNLLDNDVLVKWIPGLALAMILLLASRKHASPLALPLVLGGYFALYHLTLFAAGISIEEAKSENLLLDIDVDKLSIHQPVIFEFQSVDWSLVIEHIPVILSLCVLTCVVSMIQVSSIEVAIDEELDMNQELKANGLANTLTGIAGGLIAYHAVSSTLLAHKFGTASRWVAVVIIVVCLMPFFLNASFLGYFPVSLLAGIILYLGIDLLLEWIVKTRTRLPFSEYIVVLIIFLVSTYFGFPPAILCGLFLGAMLFVVRYSNFGVVESSFSGDQCRSGVMRTDLEENYLTSKSERMAMLKLKGFLFFGTSNSLFEYVKSFVENENRNAKWILFDFMDVPGIDTTAMMGLGRIRRLLSQMDISVFACNVSASDVDMVRRALGIAHSNANNEITGSADEGLERVENRILQDLDSDTQSKSISFSQLLSQEGWQDDEISLFYNYLVTRKLNDGDVLITAGSDDSAMYFIESGLLEVYATQQKKVMRLRGYTAGIVIGEMAIYSGSKRTADVIARGDAVVFELGQGKLNQIEHDHPHLAHKIHRLLGKNLALKIMDASRFSHIRK